MAKEERLLGFLDEGRSSAVEREPVLPFEDFVGERPVARMHGDKVGQRVFERLARAEEVHDHKWNGVTGFYPMLAALTALGLFVAVFYATGIFTWPFF